MTEHLMCNVCERPGSLAAAREVGSVRCNVRAFHDESFTLWRCVNCETLHCKEGVDLAHYYRGYFAHTYKIDPFLRNVYGNRVRQLRRAGWDAKQATLDYGCAGGLFVQYLQALSVGAAGDDPFTPGGDDAARLERKYDSVVSYDVIEHDEDPRGWMQRMIKLVKPGGLLLVATPDGARFKVRDQHLPYGHVPYHRHILSQQALTGLGRSLGLTPILVEHRDFLSSLRPTFNFRFVCSYIDACGGCSDVVNDPPQVGVFLKTPRLWFDALFGSLFPHGVNMSVVFRTPAE